MRKLKLRAIHEGRKLKDSVADVLRGSLACRRGWSIATARRMREVGTDKTTGLPVILGGRPAKPGDELTPERVADILNEQEAEWSRDPR